eukprot:TRINITY_DN3531_c0_g2_i1.p1 TRINITY_DN3531_c0_g2~~TRINITY_DN3531_c0_g2_i1.p1  ORF type:complete len:476 (+),score=85.55 TRINITY_DN3531_c0_g2_i1:38-1429(+)
MAREAEALHCACMLLGGDDQELAAQYQAALTSVSEAASQEEVVLKLRSLVMTQRNTLTLLEEEFVDISEAKDGGVLKRILVEGEGDETPPAGSSVEVHYVGTLHSDGSKFDSSRDWPENFKFDVGGGKVIKGWDQGIRTMKRGEKCILRCSSDYAFGPLGINLGHIQIPGGATLNLEVELFDWKENVKLAGQMTPEESDDEDWEPVSDPSSARPQSDLEENTTVATASATTTRILPYWVLSFGAAVVVAGIGIYLSDQVWLDRSHGRDGRGGWDDRDERDGRDERDSFDSRSAGRDGHDGRGNRDGREDRDRRDERDRRDDRFATRDARDGRSAGRDGHDGRDVRGNRDGREDRDRRDERDRRDDRFATRDARDGRSAGRDGHDGRDVRGNRDGREDRDRRDERDRRDDEHQERDRIREEEKERDREHVHIWRSMTDAARDEARGRFSGYRILERRMNGNAEA